MTPEILAPVGDKAMLAAAINAKADAVYFGVKGMNMRAAARNFELNELKSIVKQCHDANVKAFLTVNTIVYDNELEKIKQILQAAKEADIDAIICWDTAVIKLCDELQLPINISTQASVSNFEAVKLYARLGAKAVVLARDLTLEQIKYIKKKIVEEKLDIKIECFIHGAMCVAISGRCFMSQFVFGKSANRGECLQPCRREYIIEDVEKEFKLKIGNNYVMSPKDLCTVSIIDKLVEAGIDIFKIEGRNRNPEYVDVCVKKYRKLRDEYRNIKDKNKSKEIIKENNEKQNKENKKEISDEKDKSAFETSKENAIKELEKVYNRQFHTGFYLGTPTADDFHDRYGSASKTKKHFIGTIRNFFKKIDVAEIMIETGEIKVGDKIMIQGPTTGTFEQQVKEMQINHKNIDSAKKSQRIAIKVEKQCRPNDKVFTLSY